MVSSDEEAPQSTGFSLNIPKFNRSIKNRFDTRKGRPNSSSQQDQSSSVVVTKRKRVLDISDDDTVSISSASSISSVATKRGGGNKSATGRAKKRSRKEVLASISANARRMAIPIPSFRMTKKRTTSNPRLKNLSRLEREFFDDVNDENENESEIEPRNHSIGSSGDRDGPNLKPLDEEAKRKDICQNRDWNHVATAGSLPSMEKTCCTRSPTDANNKSLIAGEQGTKHIDSEDSDSSTVFNSEKEQTEKRHSHKFKSQQPDVKTSTAFDEGPKAKSLDKNSFGESINDKRKDDTHFSDVECGVSGYDCDDVTESNHQDLPIYSNESASTMITISMKATSSCQDRSTSPLYDLDRQIDALFLDTDTNTITMNMFCKSLEKQIGVSLEKPMKKKVKARVMSLLKGELNPSSSVKKTSNEFKDGKQYMESTTKNISVSENEKNENNDSNEYEASTNGEIKPNKKFETKVRSEGVNDNHSYCNSVTVEERERNKISEIGQQSNEGELDESHSSSDPASMEENENNTYSEIETQFNTKAEREVGDFKESHSSCILVHVGDEKEGSASGRNQIVGKEIEKLDDQKEIPSTTGNLTKKTSTHPCGDHFEKEKCINITETKVRSKSKKDSSKADRGRKNEAKVSDGGDKKNKKSRDGGKKTTSKTKASDVANMTAGGEAKAIPIKKPARSRKRPRKAGACALCKTCPCQKHQLYNDNENLTVLNMKSFSRSDGAIEKTLLRRLQTLEKSTERLEEQTEAVRRRLKQHKRAVWKRREQVSDSKDGADAKGTCAAASYFLPDTEIFERQQTESKELRSRIVRKAQKNVFKKLQSEFNTQVVVLCV